ncbi:hypothetical protein H6768_01710 [Candidatus Peribacteria bacterium]|nr:hypothetical protein [Candidatus Peribacteria bacterium]
MTPEAQKKIDYSAVSKERKDISEQMQKESKEYNPHALDNAPADTKAELTKKWIKKAGLDETKVLAALGLPPNASNEEITNRVIEFQTNRKKDGLSADGIM